MARTCAERSVPLPLDRAPARAGAAGQLQLRGLHARHRGGEPRPAVPDGRDEHRGRPRRSRGQRHRGQRDVDARHAVQRRLPAAAGPAWGQRATATWARRASTSTTPRCNRYFAPQEGNAYYNAIRYDPSPAMGSPTPGPSYYALLLFGRLAQGTTDLRPGRTGRGRSAPGRCGSRARSAALFLINKGAAPITVEIPAMGATAGAEPDDAVRPDGCRPHARRPRGAHRRSHGRRRRDLRVLSRPWSACSADAAGHARARERRSSSRSSRPLALTVTGGGARASARASPASRPQEARRTRRTR